MCSRGSGANGGNGYPATENPRRLDRNELALKTKGYLGKKEIDGAMARRSLIVARFDDMIAKKGQDKVLYDYPAAK